MDDLLSMSMPQMGVDFASLSEMMKPMQRPGPDQVGPGGAATFGGQDAARLQMLQKATGLAQLDAMMKAQRAGEFQASGPGRMAQIQALTKMSEANNQDTDAMIAEQRSKRMVNAGKDKNELIKQELERLAPYIDAYKTADPQRKQFIIEALAQNGEGFGKYKFGQMKPEQADMMLQGLWSARHEGPKLTQEREKVEGKEKVANIHGDTARDVAAMRASAQKESARVRSMSQPDRRKMIEQLTDKVSQGLTLTPSEQAAYVFATQMEALKHTAAAERAPPRTGLAPSGKVETTPVPKPTIPTPPGTNPGPAPSNAPAAAVADFKRLMAAAKTQADKDKLIASWKKNLPNAPLPN
jgi:hypothetical protein